MLVMKPCILAMTTMVLQFMLEGRPCTIGAQSFVLTFTLQLNVLTGTFPLVSRSNTFQNILWFVYGQGLKINCVHAFKAATRYVLVRIT